MSRVRQLAQAQGVNPQLSPLRRTGLGAGPLIPTAGGGFYQAGGATGVKTGPGVITPDPGAQAAALASWLLGVQNQAASVGQQAQTQAPGLANVLQLGSSDLLTYQAGAGASGNRVSAETKIRADLNLLILQANKTIPLLTAVSGQAAWSPNLQVIQGMLTDYANLKRAQSSQNATIAGLSAQVNNLTGQVAALQAQLKAANAAAAAAASVCVKS